MATWEHKVRTKQVHEWYVPDGDHAQLLQAIYQARKKKAELKGVSEKDLYDNDVMFAATDDGVIMYFEIEVADKGFKQVPPPDPWGQVGYRHDDDPPF